MFERRRQACEELVQQCLQVPYLSLAPRRKRSPSTPLDEGQDGGDSPATTGDEGHADGSSGGSNSRKAATANRTISSASLSRNTSTIRDELVEFRVCLDFVRSVIRRMSPLVEASHVVDHHAVKEVLGLVRQGLADLLVALKTAHQALRVGQEKHHPQADSPPFGRIEKALAQHALVVVYKRIERLSRELSGPLPVSRTQMTRFGDEQARQCWLFCGGDKSYFVPWQQLWPVLSQWIDVSAVAISGNLRRSDETGSTGHASSSSSAGGSSSRPMSPRMQAKLQAGNSIENTFRILLDAERTGFVSLDKFAGFVRLFGPFGDRLKETIQHVHQCDAFQGYLTDDDARRLLSVHCVPGTFLVYLNGFGALDLCVAQLMRMPTSPTDQASIRSCVKITRVWRSVNEGGLCENFGCTVVAGDEADEDSEDALPPLPVHDDIGGESGTNGNTDSNAGENEFECATLAEMLKHIVSESGQKKQVSDGPPPTSFPSLPWRTQAFFGVLSMKALPSLLGSGAAVAKPGTFVLRFSSTPGAFAVSVKSNSGKIFHNRVRTLPAGFCFESAAASSAVANPLSSATSPRDSVIAGSSSTSTASGEPVVYKSLKELVDNTFYLIVAAESCVRFRGVLAQAGSEVVFDQLIKPTLSSRGSGVDDDRFDNPYVGAYCIDLDELPQPDIGEQSSHLARQEESGSDKQQGKVNLLTSGYAQVTEDGDIETKPMAPSPATAEKLLERSGSTTKNSGRGVPERPTLADLPEDVAERLRKLEQELDRSRGKLERLSDKLHESEHERDREHSARVAAEHKLRLGDTVAGKQLIEAKNVKWHEILGSGGSGAKVHRATVNGLTIAVKHLKIRQVVMESREAFEKEIALLEMLSHECLVHYLGHDLRQDSGELCLFMEFYTGTLADQLKAYSESEPTPRRFKLEQIVDYAWQVARGVEYLHRFEDPVTGKKKPIAHLDIKSENVFVTFTDQKEVDECKLGDFDVSVTFGKKGQKKKNDGVFIGTLGWAAPELLQQADYDVMADVWAFGMLLYELLEMSRPFEYEQLHQDWTHSDVWERCERGERPTFRTAPIDDEAFAPIFALHDECCKIKPKERPKAKVLVEAFSALRKHNPLPRSISHRKRIHKTFFRR